MVSFDPYLVPCHRNKTTNPRGARLRLRCAYLKARFIPAPRVPPVLDPTLHFVAEEDTTQASLQFRRGRGDCHLRRRPFVGDCGDY